jgi:hypothetical protein
MRTKAGARAMVQKLMEVADHYDVMLVDAPHPGELDGFSCQEEIDDYLRCRRDEVAEQLKAAVIEYASLAGDDYQLERGDDDVDLYLARPSVAKLIAKPPEQSAKLCDIELFLQQPAAADPSAN